MKVTAKIMDPGTSPGIAITGTVTNSAVIVMTAAVRNCN
jgi:hypothetical protein